MARLLTIREIRTQIFRERNANGLRIQPQEMWELGATLRDRIRQNHYVPLKAAYHAADLESCAALLKKIGLSLSVANVDRHIIGLVFWTHKQILNNAPFDPKMNAKRTRELVANTNIPTVEFEERGLPSDYYKNPLQEADQGQISSAADEFLDEDKVAVWTGFMRQLSFSVTLEIIERHGESFETMAEQSFNLYWFWTDPIINMAKLEDLANIYVRLGARLAMIAETDDPQGRLTEVKDRATKLGSIFSRYGELIRRVHEELSKKALVSA